MPRLLTACSLTALLILPALLRADDPPKGDKDLEGTWEVVSVAGDSGEPEAPPDKMLMIVKGASMTYTTGDHSRKATIAVDPSKSPRTIDVTLDDGPEKGMVAPGIYQIKGDELLVCGAQAGKDRPTGFTAKAGAGWTLMALKRVKK